MRPPRSPSLRLRLALCWCALHAWGHVHPASTDAAMGVAALQAKMNAERGEDVEQARSRNQQSAAEVRHSALHATCLLFPLIMGDCRIVLTVLSILTVWTVLCRSGPRGGRSRCRGSPRWRPLRRRRSARRPRGASAPGAATSAARRIPTRTRRPSAGSSGTRCARWCSRGAALSVASARSGSEPCCACPAARAQSAGHGRGKRWMQRRPGERSSRAHRRQQPRSLPLRHLRRSRRCFRWSTCDSPHARALCCVHASAHSGGTCQRPSPALRAVEMPRPPPGA